MKVLGLSAFHQDASAALVVDGRPVSAAQEGLYSKTPKDASLPLRAARACLERAGVRGPELDRVVFYEKPLRRFERTLLTALRRFPRGGRAFAREISRWIGDRLWTRGQISEELGVPTDRIAFLENAVSHAAGAYFLSPFDEAAALVLGDVGEWSTCAIGRARGTRIELIEEVHVPHSLGLAASAFVQFLGFDPGQDDPWLAELAAYGTPRFRDDVAAWVGVDDDGAPLLDRAAFHFGEGSARLYTDLLVERLGQARIPGQPLDLTGADRRDVDLAASVQSVLEERVLGLARRARERTDSPNLVVAGALTRNHALASALLTRAPFDAVYLPPDPADAGAALGAALLVAHEAEGMTRGRPHEGVALGEALGSLSPRVAAGAGVGPEVLVDDLVAGRPVGWARGSLEFAAESLGARIVLGDPRPADASTRMLGALQRSEPFLRARLALPEETLPRWVDAAGAPAGALALGQVVLPARPALRAALPGAAGPDGRVRVQAVGAKRDPELHRLLGLFGERAGAPGLLIDTLALRGAVMPRFDHEALEVLDRSALAALLCGDRLYRAGAEEAA